MDPNGVCESFLVADKLINGEDAFTTMEEFRKKPEFYEHCPKRKCVTDKDDIGALSTYLFLKLNAFKNNENAEYFLMWLSDKLFKMHKEGKKKSQIKPITLDMAYKMYLERDLGYFRYWNILGNIDGLKNANLRHMNEFYKLLNHICKTIIYLKYDHNKSPNPLQNSTNSSNQYMLLYQNVSKCNSYLHLLDNLKKTYDKFRITVKEMNPNLAIYLQTLTTIENADSYFAENFTKFDFSDPKCKLQYDKNILTKYLQAKAQEKQKDSGANGDSNKQNSQPQSSVDRTPNPSAETGGSPTTPDNGDDTLKSKDKAVDDGQNKENPKGNEQTDPGSDTGNKTSPQIEPSNPSDSNSHTLTTGTNQGSESGGGLVDSQGDKVGTGDGSIDKLDGDKINQGGSGGINDGKGDKDINKEGTCSGACDGQGSPNPASVNPSSAPENSGDGSKPSGDQGATKSSGTFYGYWSSNWGNRLNPLNYLPSVSEIYETQKSILTSASNKISNAYNSAVTTTKDIYNSVVTNINNAYTASTNYINDAVNSMTSQLNPFGNFTSGDNQFGSGSLGNGSSTGGNPLKTTQIPKPDPNSPSAPSQTLSQPPTNQVQDPSKPKSNQTQDPSQPKSDQTQDPSQPPSSPKQLSSPPVSQDTLQNDASNIVHQPDPNDGKGVQTMTITKDTLPSSSTGPSNTENGSTNGTVVKMIEKSLIWCIASNKNCDVLSVGIISISIFAFLTIIYKYLSLGCTRKSKRKKNIKKVINSIGGKRPVQIIIKSYDRNKDLKPVINSVGRKKDPLLNIYKLMQADPIPFINLFFLLIFFVYKKKFNYLEL
ncbi:PIR protein CIR protein [Plasmodium vinckei vinckei]|uniref:PIR protein CIR protein n=1 Tax=Plasmodium vinckei vinckei TaxID=54757 RepID=A0A449BUI5_PLAVN|nr:PIR protein CIR protein [Plasmodium vinckei vinckei]VEV57136.1 PIR protein CIR protein [Plasmodium vinckei vinckei]